MNEIDSVEEVGRQPNAVESGRNRAPLIATLFGCAWVLLVLARPREAISEDLAERIVYALGLAAGPAIITGGVVYLVGLRKAPARWKIGSLAAILLVSILVAFVQSSGWLAPSG
jgi:hypothetical protein